MMQDVIWTSTVPSENGEVTVWIGKGKIVFGQGQDTVVLGLAEAARLASDITGILSKEASK